MNILLEEICCHIIDGFNLKKYYVTISCHNYYVNSKVKLKLLIHTHTHTKNHFQSTTYETLPSADCIFL